MLILCCFIVLLILFYKITNCKFDSVVYSIITNFLFLYADTELLSLGKVLNSNNVMISWICFLIVSIIITIIFFIKNKKNNITDLFKAKIDYINLLFLISFIMLIVLAIKVVPYNWDSMTYHLPRVMHWIQNNSIDFYSTNIVRQLSSPIFHEVILSNLYYLTGNTDAFFNLPQTIAFILNIILVYKISQKLGCSKGLAYLSSLLAFSMPIAFAESITTQVDNLSALFSLVFTYYILDFCDVKKKLDLNFNSISKVVVIACCLGFGYITKPTVLISMGLFLVYLFIVFFIRKDKIKNIIICIFISVILSITIVGPSIYRNYKTFNAISDPIVGEKQLLHTNSKRYLIVNFTKNFAWNYYNTIIPNSDELVFDNVTKMANKLNVDINDLSISEAKREYRLAPEMKYDHDYAVNPLVSWTITVLFIIYIIKLVKNKFRLKKKLGIYSIIVIISMLFMFLITRFQVWETRYEISYLMLLCPIVSLLISIVFEKKEIRYFVCGVITVIAVFSLWNQYDYHKKYSECKDINSCYFKRNMSVYESYYLVSDYINKLGDNKTIGLDLSEDDYEYTWFILNKNSRIEHINVNNASNVYADNSFVPDVVISTKGSTELTVNGTNYIKEYSNGICNLLVKKTNNSTKKK